MRTPAKLLGALMLVALVLSGCGSSGNKFKSETLKFTEKDTNDFGFADAAPKSKVGPQGPERFSPADQIAFRSDLVDAGKKTVGSIDAICNITKAGTFENSREVCTGVATVPGGTITVIVGGAVFNNTRGAVVGGTGKYRGATGEFTSVGQNASKDTFDLSVLEK